MTRVLIVEPAGELWGSERALLDLIDSAPNLEIAVCSPPTSPLVAELKTRGVRVIESYVARSHEQPRWRRLHAALGVFGAALSFRPDVIHLNQSGAYKVALPTAAALGLPIVAHVRLFEDVAYLAAQRPDSRRVRALIAISDAVAAAIRSHPALGPIPVRRIYDTYRPALWADGAEREARDRIICIGRITPAKGQDLLLAAMSLTGIVPPNVDCLIVGSGEADYVQHLRGASSDIRNRVRWCGFAGDVGPLLRTSRVLAFPSHSEGLGRVVMEAWDAGVVPVAYAGAGGSAEIIAAADAGLVYPEQSPECLARALRTALTLPPSETQRYVANGRAWTSANCGAEQYGFALTEVFAAAARTPTKRPAAFAR